jgi:outer membrane protein assembly factor BamB
MDLARDNLIAFDIRSGTTIWKTELPFERSGAHSLLADENTVFVVTSVSVDAYEVTTGELKWSTRLGDGHVSIVSQLDSDKVRVYYGDKLHEIDSETGKILTTLPKDIIVWVLDDIILQETPTYKLIAINNQTDELLWTNDRGPYVREDYKPQDIGGDNLIVGFVRGICVLNLQTGEYSWCRPEIDITKLAIDYQSQQGFAMQDDLVLLTIDLQTGNVLGETSFLSSEPIDEQIGFLSSIIFSDGVVVISFSDSGQTFGLEFKDLK